MSKETRGLALNAAIDMSPRGDVSTLLANASRIEKWLDGLEEPKSETVTPAMLGSLVDSIRHVGGGATS